METPPPPGVSEIGTDGKQRTPIEDEAPKPRPQGATQKFRASQPKPRARGSEVLRNTQGARAVNDDIPSGVKGRSASVIEVPMPHMRAPAASTRSFQSIDGNTYVFRTRDGKGRPLENRFTMTLFLAIIEMAKGGNPLVVFDAFNVKINDFHDRPIFPIPEGVELPDAFAAFMQEALVEEPEEEEYTGLSLGE